MLLALLLLLLLATGLADVHDHGLLPALDRQLMDEARGGVRILVSVFEGEYDPQAVTLVALGTRALRGSGAALHVAQANLTADPSLRQTLMLRPDPELPALLLLPALGPKSADQSALDFLQPQLGQAQQLRASFVADLLSPDDLDAILHQPSTHCGVVFFLDGRDVDSLRAVAASEDLAWALREEPRVTVSRLDMGGGTWSQFEDGEKAQQFPSAQLYRTKFVAEALPLALGVPAVLAMVNRRCGTSRSVVGDLLPAVGHRVPELDALADGFLALPRHEQEQRLHAARQVEAEGADEYVSVMEQVARGGGVRYVHEALERAERRSHQPAAQRQLAVLRAFHPFEPVAELGSANWISCGDLDELGVRGHARRALLFRVAPGPAAALRDPLDELALVMEPRGVLVLALDADEARGCPRLLVAYPAPTAKAATVAFVLGTHQGLPIPADVSGATLSAMVSEWSATHLADSAAPEPYDLAPHSSRLEFELDAQLRRW